MHKQMKKALRDVHVPQVKSKVKPPKNQRAMTVQDLKLGRKFYFYGVGTDVGPYRLLSFSINERNDRQHVLLYGVCTLTSKQEHTANACRSKMISVMLSNLCYVED